MRAEHGAQQETGGVYKGGAKAEQRLVTHTFVDDDFLFLAAITFGTPSNHRQRLVPTLGIRNEGLNS